MLTVALSAVLAAASVGTLTIYCLLVGAGRAEEAAARLYAAAPRSRR